MGANALTERGGVLIVNGEGDFNAWLTVPGTNEWREISWRQDNYPALHTADVTVTPEELAAHIQRNFAGWTVRKMNLPGLEIDVDGDILEPLGT
jgi:rhodanese-related sulfurtransferase